MHNRRARPTLRVLREDLSDGWDNPYPARMLKEGRHFDLHPVSDLAHPIIAKAVESFPEDPVDHTSRGKVQCCAKLPLHEIRHSQWRGGVWIDPEMGVCWLVVAGLAKGNHEDHDDFYEVVKRENDEGEPNRWLPGPDDIRLLKQETAARISLEWKLGIQAQVLDALRAVHAGGAATFDVPHPVLADQQLAKVCIEVAAVRDGDYRRDDVVVQIDPSRDAGSNWIWDLTTQVLVAIEPPVQGWDRVGNSYSNIGEPGAWTERAAALAVMVESRSLAVAEPGRVSHFTHKHAITEGAISGKAAPALCGVYFVPVQNPDEKPICDVCATEMERLLRVR